MFNDSSNNVVNDNTKASTSYSTVGSTSYIAYMNHFQRDMINLDASGQDYNITDGQQQLSIFTAYGTLKSNVIQEASTHILNTKITKTIDLIAVGGSSSALIGKCFIGVFGMIAYIGASIFI